MIIDPIDLKMIRLLELHGSVPVYEIFSKFQISEDEISLRIKNFEETGFIQNYGVKLFVPGILGGKWYWGCVVAETTSRFRPEHSVPCLEEIVENLTFPQGVCPNTSLLFYTRELKETYQLINKTPGVKYAEVYKIDEYNIKVPNIMIQKGWQLISMLYDRIAYFNYADISKLINTPETEEDIKLSRLIWSQKNKKGIVSIFPNFNWSVLKNYAHVHIAVVTKMRIKELRKLVNDIGFSGNIASRFKKRFLQVEFNVWGFSDMQTVLARFKEIGKITVEGFSLAYKNSIENAWLKQYISENI